MNTSVSGLTRFFSALGVIVIIVGLAILSQRGANTQTASGKITIIAGENFYGSIASQIGGDKVSVHSILNDPGIDPHLYDSAAADAAAVSNADIIIKNGLGYDDFMDNLLTNVTNHSQTVLTIADILNVSKTANPHLWYDLPRMTEVAEAIEASLSAKAPTDTAYFEAQLATFEANLQPSLDLLSSIKTTYQDAPVGYTERVPGYILEDAGLAVITPQGFSSAIEDGNEPSPADSQAFEKLITNRSIRALLYNAQASSTVTEHIRTLAEHSGIPIIGVTETMPIEAKSYQDWQYEQINALYEALQH